MKKLTALGMILILLLSLCACQADPYEDWYGRYELYAMDYDENTIILAKDLFEG